MTAHNRTLLAKLAPMFGAQTENLAVAALGHILSGSQAARRALSDLLAAGGATVGEIAQVRTQATGQEGERPDLAGFDRDGRERVLIEAKFWAGLTGNQPIAYLERLRVNTPSTLLFVSPVARIETLWNELLRTVAESQSGITLAPTSEVEGLRSAAAGDGRYLLLTSWQALLGRMATQAAAAADSHAEKDIGQLHGLAAQQDDEAFLPLRREEFGPEFPRRMLGLQRLVNDATDRAVTAGFASVKGLKVTSQAWGYGRYLKLAYTTPWFGIDFYDWAWQKETPLWLWFSGTDAQGKPLRALEPLRQRRPPELFEHADGLVVPVELPVRVEYDAVLAAVVARLEEVTDLIQAGASRAAAP